MGRYDSFKKRAGFVDKIENPKLDDFVLVVSEDIYNKTKEIQIGGMGGCIYQVPITSVYFYLDREFPTLSNRMKEEIFQYVRTFCEAENTAVNERSKLKVKNKK